MDTLWALKHPDGQLDSGTASPDRSECWSISWWRLPLAWREKYEYRWDASIKAAARLGYKMVRCKLVEVKK
jgi:hypothetical protein